MPPRNAIRNKNFGISMTPQEYELLFQAAALEGESASAWARGILIGSALRKTRQASWAPRRQPKGAQ